MLPHQTNTPLESPESNGANSTLDIAADSSAATTESHSAAGAATAAAVSSANDEFLDGLNEQQTITPTPWNPFSTLETIDISFIHVSSSIDNLKSESMMETK